MRVDLLLTAVHDRTVPAAQQVAEHRRLVDLARRHGFATVGGQHFGAPDICFLQPIPYLASFASEQPSAGRTGGTVAVQRDCS